MGSATCIRLTPAGSVPFQPGPVMAYVLRAGAGGALAGHLEHVGPAVEHREEVIAALRSGRLRTQGSFEHVEPRDGVQRVGVRRRDVLERRVGYRAASRTGPSAPWSFRCRDVRQHPPRVFHRDQRIAEDVGIDAQSPRFLLLRVGLRRSLFLSSHPRQALQVSSPLHALVTRGPRLRQLQVCRGVSSYKSPFRFFHLVSEI